jgi:hypothetical protein
MGRITHATRVGLCFGDARKRVLLAARCLIENPHAWQTRRRPGDERVSLARLAEALPPANGYRHERRRRRTSPNSGSCPRGCCVSIVSIAHAFDEGSNPCSCFPQRTKMSWQTVLTLLTALTVVARFSTPELSLIVRVPARPCRLKDISIPSM